MGNQLKQRKVAEACDHKYKQNKTQTKNKNKNKSYPAPIQTKNKKAFDKQTTKTKMKHPEPTAGLEKAQPKLRGAPGLTPTHPAKTSQRTHGTEGSPTEMTKRT